METVVTGWVDIAELRFEAAAQTLTIVYTGGETRTITAVSRSGFERLVGGSDAEAAAGADSLGRVRQALALYLSIVWSMRLFQFRSIGRRGRGLCSYRERTCQGTGMTPLRKIAC